jgi:hypothetical protein
MATYHEEYNALCAEYGEKQKALWLAHGTETYTELVAELKDINDKIVALVATVHTPERQRASQIIGVPLPDMTGR